MKKLVSLALALVMVLAMGVVASATTADDATLTALGDKSHDINATYTAGTEGVAYSVDIAWTDPVFTYTNGAKSWDAEDHVWVDDSEDGSWTSKTAGQVVITNHSSVAVVATVTITDGDEYLELGATASDTLDAGTPSNKDNADSLTVSIGLKSTAPSIESTGKIGTVKVALTAAPQ